MKFIFFMQNNTIINHRLKTMCLSITQIYRELFSNISSMIEVIMAEVNKTNIFYNKETMKTAFGRALLLKIVSTVNIVF